MIEDFKRVIQFSRLYNKLVDRIFEDESTPALHFRIGDVYIIDHETVVFSLL